MISIILPLIIGFVFDMLTEIKFGFYFIPAAVMSLVFYFLPFVFVLLNIVIAFSAAFAISFIWSYILAGMNIPSAGYMAHIVLYLFLVGGVLYLINALQKK